MRISYEKGLEKIANALEEYGHELFPVDLSEKCEAVLFENTLPPVNADEKGALYVYVRGKTPEQLNKILTTRLYSNLY